IVLCVAPAEAGGAVFRSLEAGAVACVGKPAAGMPAAELNATIARLQQTVRLMAEVKVVRRWSPARVAAVAAARAAVRPGARVVGIGASTGGPAVLQTILAELPREFELPVLVVQHIARGFLPGMADWLRQTSGLKVQIAAAGLLPQPGHVYLAPDDLHLGVDGAGRLQLSRAAPESGLRPSVACLFRSLAQVYGADAIGVLLTGMGKDGAADLKVMKDRGAVTIVQDSASSVVHGMPGEAIALGAATHVLPADRIAAMLMTLVRQASRKEGVIT
ncbi:MAG: chemotaxis protein CheB, partial [Lysobacteraceae bacterium]